MGRASTRAAIQSALQGAGLTYVGTVFAGPPSYIDEASYTETLAGQAIKESSNGSACVIVVNITQDNRERYALVGRGPVADWNKHLVVLEIFFTSTSGDAVAAQDDYDAMYDSLVPYIRSNPTLSAPASIWSAGEYRYGVKHSQGRPQTSADGMTTLIVGTVSFEAWEQLVGTGV